MILDEIALSLHRGITPRTAVRLMERFTNAGGLFSASPGELKEAGIRPDIASDISGKKFHRQAENELLHCRKHGITPVGVSSGDYPPLLRECCDYPVVLYVTGSVAALKGEMLAVVGTRKITSYGTAICEKLVAGLAGNKSGLTILSGLAYGVDCTSHRAAMASGLNTVAVLGNKLPRIYPAEHTSLAQKIIEKGGAIISELHSGAFEGRMNFVARNRIIAGMSRGTLVVESPEKGGSMITAEMASGYERALMAVPGRATDENSSGTNRLIRSMKAAPVCDAADILSELGLGESFEKRAATPAQSRHNIRSAVKTGDPVLDTVASAEGGASVDFISDRTGMQASEVMASLFSLEMEGVVRKAPGGVYIKV